MKTKYENIFVLSIVFFIFNFVFHCFFDQLVWVGPLCNVYENTTNIHFVISYAYVYAMCSTLVKYDYFVKKEKKEKKKKKIIAWNQNRRRYYRAPEYWCGAHSFHKRSLYTFQIYFHIPYMDRRKFSLFLFHSRFTFCFFSSCSALLVSIPLLNAIVFVCVGTWLGCSIVC